MRAVLSFCAAALSVTIVGAAGSAVAGEPLKQSEALEWLQRIAGAARQQSYAGTFVYQHHDVVETSRIVHVLEGHVEYEKLTMLDGPAREIVRRNDEVRYYYPEVKLVRTELRKPRRNSFPALLPEELSLITEHYDIRKAEQERVAGFDAQALVLEPRDGMRYGHKFWADQKTGLLLKAKMFGEKHQVVEQFAFTQLTIGGVISKDQVNPSHVSKDWRWEKYSAAETSGADSGWIVKSQPAGFRKVLETRRSKSGNSDLILTHIVFSDGLAAISVFIEPMAGKNVVVEGLSHQGSISIFTRMIGDQRVTVLGETPANTVMQVANSIMPAAPKGR